MLEPFNDSKYKGKKVAGWNDRDRVASVTRKLDGAGRPSFVVTFTSGATMRTDDLPSVQFLD